MPDLSWLTERPIAHRGFHDQNKLRWENTMSAFEEAARRGYAIECDVHLSSDGVPVILHDDELKRLTGTDGRACERTAAELTAMRIGGTEDRVPTLRQMLERIAGRTPLVIELKGVEGKDEGLVAKVAALLADYRGKAAIMSFDHWLVRQFARSAPGIPGGLIGYGADDGMMEAHFSMLAYPLAFVSYSVTELPNRFVSFVRERLGMPVITWTVRDDNAVALTRAHADQMTFEGFAPEVAAVA